MPLSTLDKIWLRFDYLADGVRHARIVEAESLISSWLPWFCRIVKMTSIVYIFPHILAFVATVLILTALLRLCYRARIRNRNQCTLVWSKLVKWFDGLCGNHAMFDSAFRFPKGGIRRGVIKLLQPPNRCSLPFKWNAKPCVEWGKTLFSKRCSNECRTRGHHKSSWFVSLIRIVFVDKRSREHRDNVSVQFLRQRIGANQFGSRHSLKRLRLAL